MSPPRVLRYNVFGVGVSALSFKQAVDLVIGVRGQKRLGYVCLCTAHGLDEARADPAYRRIFNESWLTTPDGMPLVWLGPRGVERVYGPDLMQAVCEAGRACGLRHYLYGGTEGVAAELRARLEKLYPGVQMVGTYTPPFRELNESEFEQLKADVARTQPDLVWVGLGTPKQERFMAGPGRQLDTGLLVGVGAAFDLLSGRVRQAPRWVRRIGLEWLFRLSMEPLRLGPRYFRTNPLFILRVAAQKLGIRRYPMT